MGTLGGLSEAEARIAELEQELVAAEQARDAARAETVIQQQRAGATQVLLDWAEARATALGALLRRAQWHQGGGQTVGHGTWRLVMSAAEYEAALDGGAGETDAAV